MRVFRVIVSVCLAVLLVVMIFGSFTAAFGQNNGALLPALPPQFFNASGLPASAGRLCTTTTGTSTPLATFSNPALTSALPNPIVLDAVGRPTTNGSTRTSIYIQPGPYRITLYANGTGNTCNGTAVGAQIWSQDGVYDKSSLNTFDNVRLCTRFPGSTAGAKIANCIADLPAAGGVADARGFEGAQTISSTITITKPITLLVCAATFNMTAGIRYSTGFNVIGCGQTATTFNWAGSTNSIFKTTDVGTFGARAHFEGFKMTFSNLNDIGIDLTSFSESTVRDVFAEGGGVGSERGIGVLMSAGTASSYSNAIETSNFQYLNEAIRLERGANENRIQFNQIILSNTGIMIDNSGAGWGGLDITEPNNLMIVGNRIESNVNYGIRISGRSTKMIGNRLEANGTNANIWGVADGPNWEPHLFEGNFFVGGGVVNTSTGTGARYVHFAEDPNEYYNPSTSTRNLYPAAITTIGSPYTNATSILRGRTASADGNIAIQGVGTTGGVELSSHLGNYVVVSGGTSGVTPVIATAGVDSNINTDIRSKGTSVINLGSNYADYLSLQGGTGTILLFPSGSSTNISADIRGKGTGIIKLGQNQTDYFDVTTGTGAISITANGVSADVNTSVGGKGAGAVIMTSRMVLSSVAFGSLGTPANGSAYYCSDCTKATPCASGGSGAFAKRINGAWDCD